MMPAAQHAAGTARRGFTFIEVLTILLVISVGLLSVLGLVAYALHRARLAQASATGMATAESVALDPLPRIAPEVTSDWFYAPYAMNAAGVATSTAQGFVNGFYVIRTETSMPVDVVATGKNGTVYIRSANVTVDVYDTLGGQVVASYTTRIVRQRGQL